MGTVYVDAAIGDDLRRERLFAGELFVYSSSTNSAGLCGVARDMSEKAFAPHDPPVAEDSMTAEDYAQILADLKPRFIHQPRCKELIAGLLADLGCDVDRTYFDVPRLRTMAHGEYMKVGLALQFHPHRDTWFSAPFAQLNWWLPVYEIESENSMAFHPRYFDRPSRTARRSTTTTSGTRTGRQQAAQQVKQGRLAKQPEAQEDPRARPGGPRRDTGRGRSRSFPQPRCIRLCRTQRIGRGSASTFARSTSTTFSSAGQRRTSTLPARGRRWATSCGQAISSRCRRT